MLTTIIKEKKILQMKLSEIYVYKNILKITSNARLLGMTTLTLRGDRKRN